MTRVAITRNPNLKYSTSDSFSPDAYFPEYPFEPGLLSPDNQIYSLVRKCLYEYGCDTAKNGASNWNPLGAWIKRGDRVFILPNFVMHRRPNETYEEFCAKCTHSSVIRAVMDYAVIATGDPSLVSFGNAPLQGCDYERLKKETCSDKLQQFYSQQFNVDVGPHDLRLLASRWTKFGALIEKQFRDPKQAIMFDLGEFSQLEKLFEGNLTPLVRVGDYSAEETMSYHRKGRHVYILNRRILESDVIISVPKLKTHQKVGITCALKGTVGSIARKECLAHHRRGGPEDGGDEYPKSTFVRNIASLWADMVAGENSDFVSNVFRVASKVLYRTLRSGASGIMGGAWSGNDTAWRMTLDIARILRYARLDGSLSDVPIRHHLAFVDGIIAGEGEGPLTPSPRNVGAVLFSPDICAADLACSYVMGFDPYKIPLVKNSFSTMPYPITESKIEDVQLTLDGQAVSSQEIVTRFAPHFLATKGWRSAIETNIDD